MSKHGVSKEKEPKEGVVMTGKPSKNALTMKPIDETALGSLSPEQRERKHAELVYSEKIFNNINKLRKLFRHAFHQNEWDFLDSGKIFTFTNKRNPDEIIKIEKKKREIKFSGTPTSKIVEAVNRYEHEAGIDMDFEIEARTLEDAVELMKDLHANGFDINKISEFNLKSKNEKYDIDAIIAEITHSPKNKSANVKRPKPGKKSHSEN